MVEGHGGGIRANCVVAAVSDLELTPEALAGVSKTQAALRKEADHMAAVGDPLAPSWAAMASAGEANNRLLVDVFLKTQKLLDDNRKPWTRDETRALVTQLDQTLLHRWTAFNRAGIAIGVGVALLVGATCFGGGYWFRASAETSPIVTGCRFAPQPAGGEAWNCTFWTRMPTPGQR